MLAVVGLLLGGLLALALWFALAQPIKVLPRIRTMPAFLLTDQDGQAVGDAELRGRMVLLSFGYTRCGAGCAEQDGRLQALRAALADAGAAGPPLAFARISLDPAHDTPALLRSYARAGGPGLAGWIFLTGAPAEVKGLAGGELGIYYERPAADGSMAHDQRALLIDERGILRARYGLADLEPARLTRDLGLLAQERQSSGLLRQVYEVSHLFLCYPD